MSVLRITGVNLDVDELVEQFQLEDISIWHKGQKWVRESVREDSGVTIGLSRAEFSDLEGLLKDITDFLESKHDALIKMIAFPGVEEAYIDFPIERRAYMQNDYLPPLLIRLAADLNLGINIASYPQPCESELKKDS